MVNRLIELFSIQKKHLENLLLLLEVQYKMIMAKDAFGLEGLVSKLEKESKLIAQIEVERRNLINNASIVEYVNTSNDDNLKKSYKNLVEILEKVIENKNTNELLLKQRVIFTNKMLSIMNPDRQIKTYNSNGNLSK